MLIRYPGSAESPSKFFDIQRDSKEVQSIIPLDRWDADRLLSIGPEANKIYARFSASFEDTFIGFDLGLFGMTKAEANSTDPQVHCRSSTKKRSTSQ